MRRTRWTNFLVYFLVVTFILTAVPTPFVGEAFAQGVQKFSTGLVSVEDVTGVRGLGDSVKQALQKSLEASPNFETAALANVEKVVKDMGLTSPLSADRAAEVGAKLNLQTIMMAKIQKYEKLQDPLRVKAELIVNLVDVKSGIIISKSQVLAYSSSQDLANPTDEFMMKDVVNNAVQLAMKEIADNLKMIGAVVSYNPPDDAMISLGKKDGLNDNAEIAITRNGRYIASGHVIKLQDGGTSKVALTNVVPDTKVQPGDTFQVVFNPTPERLARLLKEAGKSAPTTANVSSGFLAVLGALALIAIGKNGGDQASKQPDQVNPSTVQFTHLGTENGLINYRLQLQVLDANNNPVPNQPVEFNANYGTPSVQDVSTNSSGIVTADFSFTYEQMSLNSNVYPMITVTAQEMTTTVQYTGQDWQIVTIDKYDLANNGEDKATLNFQVMDKLGKPVSNRRIFLSPIGTSNALGSWTDKNENNLPNVAEVAVGPLPAGTYSYVDTDGAGLATAYLRAGTTIGNAEPYLVTFDGSNNFVDSTTHRWIYWQKLFNFGGAPYITSLTPDYGLPGDYITITGTGFGAPVGDRDVTFTANNGTGTVSAINLVRTWSDTQIVLQIPTGAISGQVHVKSGGVWSNGVAYNILNNPRITDITPENIPAGSATPITIIGDGFGANQGDSSVSLAGTDLGTAVSWCDTMLVYNLPYGVASGVLAVRVNGVVSNDYRYTVGTSIFSFTPTSGSVGTLVTITGQNFGNSQGTGTVSFNGILGTPTGWTDNTIIVPVPVGASTGRIQVVSTQYGATQSGNLFSVASPTITSLNPTSGKEGDVITINGSGFGVTQGTSVVNFQGVAPVSAVTSWTDNQIVLTIPVGTQTGNVTVTTTGGTSNGVLFTINPQITNVTPVNTPAGSATAVSIVGNNFGVNQSASTVTLNGVNLGTAATWSSTMITYMLPYGASSGPVIVTVNGVASNSYNYIVGASIFSFTPANGSVGTLVTITGQNFGNSAGAVYFGGVAGTPTTWQANAIVVSVPVGAVSGRIRVTSGDVAMGTTESGSMFTVNTPTITNLNPNSGKEGDTITIIGSGFGVTQGTSVVNFQGVAPVSAVTSWTDNQIVLTIPVGTQTGNVTVTTTGGTSNGVLFTINPQITNVTPVNTPAGSATAVSIVGNNFGVNQGASTVTLNGVNLGTAATWSSTMITYMLPYGASSGPVIVTVNGVASNSYNYIVGASIFSFTPANGSVGTLVTITGQNFGNSAGAVYFGGVAGTPNTWQANTIVVAVPVGAVSGRIRVTSGDVAMGSTESGSMFTVNTPTITSLNPTSGKEGDTVTINGSAFGATQGTSVVNFQGVAPVSAVTSWTNNQIVLTVPVGTTTGNVTVTTTGGISNGVLFTVNPQITNVTPVNTPAGSATAVSIVGNNFGVNQGASTVTLNGVNLGTAATWSSTMLTYLLPYGAISGPVVVTVNGVASNSYNYTVGASITGFNPANGSVGTLVTITGQNFGNSAGAVYFGGVAGTPTAWQVNSIIVAVPAGAVTGRIQVTSGDVAMGTTASGSLFTVNTPTITNLNPTSGKEGDVITINGSGFGANQGTSVVNFQGVAPVSAVTSWTDNQIVLTIPVGSQTGNVTVTTTGGTSNGILFTINPQITNVTPINTPGGSATAVSIVGNNFGVNQGASTITLNGSNLGTAISWTSTAITFSVPYGATSGPVVVTVNGVASNSYHYIVGASITGFTPTSGSAGTLVTVTGQNFGNSAGVIEFGGVAATPNGWTNNEIIAAVPAGAYTGRITVTSGDVAMGTTESGSMFTVTSPTITSLNPAFGIEGDTITINGSGFGATQGTSVIDFGAIPATAIIAWSDIKIIVTVPNGTQTGDVTVTTTGGTSNGVIFTVNPNITTVTPADNPAGSATPISIQGNNFGTTQGASTVTLNGVNLGTAASWCNTQITYLLPYGATSGPIIVTINGVAGNTYNYQVGASVTGFTPATGSAGTLVTITGQNFGSTGGVVEFGGVAATYTSWSPNQIVAEVPVGAYTGRISVTSGDVAMGTSESLNMFTVAAPVITSLSPNSGVEGASVTINGANFGAAQGTSTVSFGAVPVVTYTSWSDAKIVVTVPVGTYSSDVTVATTGGESNGVLFTLDPQITTVTPADNPAGSATPISIIGENFGSTQGASTVTLNGVNLGTAASWSNTQITYLLPYGATSGLIIVTINGVSDNYNYQVGASITGFNPAEGANGTLVTITGQNFGTGAGVVEFGGVAATPSTWAPTQIVAEVPVGAYTGRISVTSGDVAMGTTESANMFTVSTPAITEVTPNAGMEGNTVTIKGSGFGAAQGTSVVDFGAIPATSITSWTNIMIVLTVPAGVTTCDVTVSTTGGVSNGMNFTVNPQITNVTPANNPAGSATPISIVGNNFGATQAASIVTLNGVNMGTAASWCNTMITYLLPYGAVSGPVIVTVNGVAGNTYNYQVGASITGFNPATGANGTVVTITGQNFGSTGGQVEFGGVAATYTNWAADQIEVLVPVGAYTGRITVTSGDVAMGVTQSKEMFVVAAPAITSINPGSGMEGTAITINGSNFGAAQGTSTVELTGAAPVTVVTSWSDTKIVLTVPAGTTTGDVTVSTTGGISEGVLFTVNPQITNVTPANTPAGSATPISIVGNNFGTTQGASTVTLNGAAMGTAASWCNTQVTYLLPYGSISGSVIVTVNGVTSNTYNYQVGASITGFNPATGANGALVTITGQNFGTSAGVVEFGGVAATPSTWAPTQIVTAVPVGAYTGRIRVTSGDVAMGVTESASIFTMAAPVTTSMNPASGVDGSTITINGSNFGAAQGTSTVTFQGAAPVAVVTSWSDNKIVLTVPVGATTGDVFVTTTGGNSDGILFTVNPQITNVTPANNPAGSATPISIIGDNFGTTQGASTVSLNGVNMGTAASWCNTMITYLLPYGATSGQIIVTINGVPGNTYNYQVGASITGFNPNSGSNGTLVTITGQNFGSTGGVVEFGGVAATSTTWAPGQIVAIVPVGAYSGRIRVTSGDVAMGVTESADIFAVAAPAITSINPANGIEGTTVTISGNGFGSMQGTSTVTFQGAAPVAVVNSWSETKIVLTVPTGAATGDVFVTTTGGTSDGVLFTINPQITGITPVNVPADNLTLVTINGNNFGTNQGGSTVSLNGQDLGTAAGWTSSQLTFRLPYGSTSGPVVININGVSSNSYSYTVGATITGFNPATAAAGTLVTITGNNFGDTQGTAVVYFGGVAASSISDWRNNQIITAIPVNPGTGRVTVATVAYGTALSGGIFNVAVPTLASLAPANGHEGDTITINGTNFGTTQGTSIVNFGSLSATVVTGSWSDTHIEVTVPSGTESGNVTVTTANGVVSNGMAFTMNPQISSITPTWVPAGGTDIITINGNHFGSAQGANTITFNGTVNSGPALSWTASQITLTVPAAATTGNVVVTVSSVPSNTYYYNVGSSITSFAPATGSSGTRVTINGENFGNAVGTGTGVSFGGVVATVDSWADLMIIATLPAGAVSGKIRVGSVYGTTESGDNFTVATPAITSITPANGVEGDVVTINGTGFGSLQGTSFVTFPGAAPVTTVNNWNDTSIIVAIPSGTQTGGVKVTTTGGESNSQLFTINPQITGVTPAYQSANNTDTITITGNNFGSYQDGTIVTLHGVDLGAAMSWTTSQIVYILPYGATSGNVIVTMNGVSSNTYPYEVGASVTGINPNTGASGDLVTITGQNFGTTAGTLDFGGVAATATTWTDNQILVNAPVGVYTGRITVGTTAMGTAISNDIFTVAAPVITSLTTQEGSNQGYEDSLITIQGNNFGATQGTSVITFDYTGTPLNATNIVDWGNTIIHCYAPAGVESGGVRITTTGGVSNGSEFTLKPQITSVIPDVSATPVVMGTEITIMGKHFGSSQRTSSVTFGTYSAGTASYWTNSEIHVMVPTGAASMCLLQVNYAPDSGSPVSSNTWICYVALGITSITPTSGMVGDTIHLVGTGFTGGKPSNGKVLIGGGEVGSYLSWSESDIEVVVPNTAAMQTSTVQVIIGDNSAACLTPFVFNTPTISSITPTSTYVGQEVTIAGSWFGSMAPATSVVANPVRFNVAAAGTVTGWTPSAITVTVPEAATTGNVVVETVGGISGGSYFTVVPLISTITPARATQGSQITIAGSGFGSIAGTGVTFTAGVLAPIPTNTKATDLWTATSIVVTVPNGVQSGSLVVQAPTVASNAVAFYVTPTIDNPTINAGGGIAAGFVMTINGRGLGDTQNGSTVWLVSTGGPTFAGTIAAPGDWTESQIKVTYAAGAFATGPGTYTVYVAKNQVGGPDNSNSTTVQINP